MTNLVAKILLRWIGALFAVGLAGATWAQASSAAPVAAEGTYFHRYFSGTIDGKFRFTMDLKELDGHLSGTYRYAGKRMDIYLGGKLEPAGSFVLRESGGAGSSGTFSGTLTPDRLAGLWQSGDGKRTLPFVADRTSEVHIGSKAEILTAAIGDYPLDTISGSGGANGMWDTWREKGHWRSNISGISGGMRQGSGIDLTPADLRLLDGLHVVVDPDLSTRLVSSDRTLLTIPYQADGLPIELTHDHNEVALGTLKGMTPHTAVHDERLYLLVRDGVDYSADLSGEFIATTTDILVVSYSIVDHTLAVRFIEGHCCGGTEFTFKRRDDNRRQR